eukprot:15378867-Alexandrium_andersonii.AAC.1
MCAGVAGKTDHATHITRPMCDGMPIEAELFDRPSIANEHNTQCVHRACTAALRAHAQSLDARRRATD